MLPASAQIRLLVQAFPSASIWIWLDLHDVIDHEARWSPVDWLMPRLRTVLDTGINKVTMPERTPDVEHTASSADTAVSGAQL